MLRQEALLLRDITAKQSDSTRQLETAAKEARDVISKYEAALVILTESRAQQDAIRERWENTDMLFREAQQLLLAAGTEYREAALRAVSAARSAFDGLTALTESQGKLQRPLKQARRVRIVFMIRPGSIMPAHGKHRTLQRGSLLTLSRPSLWRAAASTRLKTSMEKQDACLGKQSQPRTMPPRVKDSVSKLDEATSEYRAAKKPYFSSRGLS